MGRKLFFLSSGEKVMIRKCEAAEGSSIFQVFYRNSFNNGILLKLNEIVANVRFASVVQFEWANQKLCVCVCAIINSYIVAENVEQFYAIIRAQVFKCSARWMRIGDAKVDTCRTVLKCNHMNVKHLCSFYVGSVCHFFVSDIKAAVIILMVNNKCPPEFNECEQCSHRHIPSRTIPTPTIAKRTSSYATIIVSVYLLDATRPLRDEQY